MNKKFVYQVGNNKKVILLCTANQISSKKCVGDIFVYVRYVSEILQQTFP